MKKHTKNMETCKDYLDALLANEEAWATASQTLTGAAWDAGYESFMAEQIRLMELAFGHGVGHPKPRQH